jgi:hypothetical protein
MRTSASLGFCVAVLVISGCQPREPAEVADTAATAPTVSAAPTTDEAKIQSAMAAAPDSISQAATIMDWPATMGGQPRQLRAGTNGWVCFPMIPPTAGASGEDSMCLDGEFQKWAGAWMSKQTPRLSAVGIAYMLRGEVKGASMTDPYATEQTARDWVRTGPHIMVATPNTATLAALPGTPTSGGPWVMWKGTPYAHIMVPLE